MFPVLNEMKGRDEKVKSGDSREQLRDWLAEYFTSSASVAKYELKVGLHNLLWFGNIPQKLFPFCLSSMQSKQSPLYSRAAIDSTTDSARHSGRPSPY
jgi:hypothetical protein